MFAVSALAMAGLIFVWTKPAFAEFEIIKFQGSLAF